MKDSARSRAIFVGSIWHEREKFILRARFSSLPRVKSRPTRTPWPKLGFSFLYFCHFSLSLSILLVRSLFSHFISLPERESGSGASEPFIIFLVTSHPGKTSWQRNYVCDDSTPVVVSSSPELLPFLAHNVLSCSTTRLKSSGSSTAANCRTVRRVDGTLPHVTKHAPRVILANNTSTFEFHRDIHDNNPVILKCQSLNTFNTFVLVIF